ncbi:hypothetical protein GUITHDRAFT_155487 [Guillardia theta CCMP2712]|uniref:G-patch domain-containing protein n=2 Tax=Guillardia theta TaxID=55529 RepID=L1IHN2_GUITC|nr:hypothetical protein GUITHDRAFT_155487 [Guillardia theta CCMP2712]EKX35439.1 hypothetical protein GUITHDRAFT_155487 [Guillardia theta CCMP2712]|eukprot:XP_005822419.1 hypothetical protein GUITHDRAFT_155487 [Guillardia theta CCMP2712]
MKRMGWEEGKGLGAQSQGITAALQAHKTGNKTGRIVSNELGQLGAPSRCVLLTNMVGAGEVDERLEEETKQECSKYGFISRCVIHELPPGAPEDQAVRIFLLFGKQESAMKAVMDLDGRFFGGRQVRASFFGEDDFANKKLDPKETDDEL